MCDREVVSQIVSPHQFKVKCRSGERLIWICISVYIVVRLNFQHKAIISVFALRNSVLIEN